MDFLIWTGAGLTMLGVAALVWCIVAVARARRSGLAESALRAKLQRIVVINTGALGVSAIGLMLVVIGIIFG